MAKRQKDTTDYKEAISASGFSIYNTIEVGDPNLWIPSKELEIMIDAKLGGISLKGLPLRTRSKVVKQKICEALGYPVPETFNKTKPRFPGQNFDTYIQKSNNLQVWNEELSPTRRYVIIKVDSKNKIELVRVVNGDTLALLDTTGTLTQKYQARLVVGDSSTELISKTDTDNLLPITKNFDPSTVELIKPTDYPQEGNLMPIEEIYKRLVPLVGESFANLGQEQERNRGAILHKLICEALGYKNYRDNGRFPDITHQLLEVKLQTSPTIDLGLVTPDSKDPLDFPKVEGKQMRHRDVRYAIFKAELIQNKISITNIYLVTGKDFFSRFTRFEGKILNKKLQIPLPTDFFDDTPKAL